MPRIELRQGGTMLHGVMRPERLAVEHDHARGEVLVGWGDWRVVIDETLVGELINRLQGIGEALAHGEQYQEEATPTPRTQPPG